MKRTAFALAALTALVVASPALAKVDLVTLPGSDRSQVTIYNSADLTLVRDARTLTMRKGLNRLQYSWAGTQIDPTSLELLPGPKAEGVTIKSVEYPPRVQGVGVWNVEAKAEGKAPFEISAFASGLSWRAFYMATLSPDEESVKIEGYVRVDNQSGEDFENAETRLVVGRINLLDRIAELSRRQYPYGAPWERAEMDLGYARDAMPAAAPMMARAAEGKMAMSEMRPKEIVKEGLSEYFLYTIEGTEDLPNGWSKRLASLAAENVKVKNLYRFEEERYGQKPVRFLSFKNDEAHNLGKEPLPDGAVKVYRSLGREGRLAFVGSQTVKYIPKNSEVDLQFGPTDLVTVKPVLIDYSSDNYEWRDNTITGWDEHHTVKVEVENSQPIPVKIELRRNIPGKRWELTSEGDAGKYEKVDADTVMFTLDLKPGEKRTFSYRLLLKQGSRAM